MSRNEQSKPTVAAGKYWHESARPLTSLAFVIPFLLFYEVGVLTLGPLAIRNAADVWLRTWLDFIGFGQYFLLPILTCGALLAWHHATGQPWRFRGHVLYGMWIESMLFGLLLLVLAVSQRALFSTILPAASAPSSGHGGFWALMVGYVGAGIYEELLFRLLLLPAVLGAFRLTGLSRRLSTFAAVVTVSLLFSAAHYQFDVVIAGQAFSMPYGDSFAWYSFLFRFSAGVFFSLLFWYRGFGIAVGTHAIYDLYTLY
ncbi:MAG: CPBP family intramembrane metalloprotease [Planctomycetaceae bacterium]|nr:MAG: CPBP family intramembrane metalloprotease [Planctomycetaceae bacterium]